MDARTTLLAITLGVMILNCDDPPTGLTQHDPPAPPVHDPPAPPVVGSIALNLEADTLSVRQTTQLLAIVLSVDGGTLTGQVITFESGDEDIVAISEAGLVTAMGPGTATITARAGDRSATITIYVRRAASISIAPSDRTVGVDDTLRVKATVLDANGAPVPDADVRWIDEVGVPVVRQLAREGLTGPFLALAPGRETITAETEGLRAEVDITVVSGVSSVLILQDSSITVTHGDTVSANVIVRDTTGAVIADPQVVFLCQSAPVPPDARQGACLFDLITLDSNSFVFGSGTFMEGTVEVVARSGGVNSNTMYVVLAFGDPHNPWDY